MATIRHAALNLAEAIPDNAIPDKASLKIRRMPLGWDDDDLLAAVRGRRI